MNQMLKSTKRWHSPGSTQFAPSGGDEHICINPGLWHVKDAQESSLS